jgi:hypothetical protein
VGFDAAGLLVARIDLPQSRYPERMADGRRLDPSRGAFFDHLLTRLRTLPGVAGATIASGVPPRFGFLFAELDVEGKTLPEGERSMPLSAQWVDPDYFRVLGVPVRAGRTFAAGERDNVVVVSEAFARRYWPEGHPIGRRLKTHRGNAWETVVGVVGNVAARGLDAPLEQPQVYYPVLDSGPMTVVVRAADGNAMRLLPRLKTAVASIDATLPLREVATAARTSAIAAVGLYGVLSFSVAQRTREIGIRMALGARAASVRAMVLAYGLRLTALGLALGMAGALAATRLAGSLLYGVGPRDPATFAAAALTVGLVSLAAAYLPARRATRVDPLEAIRGEG